MFIFSICVDSSDINSWIFNCIYYILSFKVLFYWIACWYSASPCSLPFYCFRLFNYSSLVCNSILMLVIVSFNFYNIDSFWFNSFADCSICVIFSCNSFFKFDISSLFVFNFNYLVYIYAFSLSSYYWNYLDSFWRMSLFLSVCSFSATSYLKRSISNNNSLSDYSFFEILLCS